MLSDRDLLAKIKQLRSIVEAQLDMLFPDIGDAPEQLHRSMRYSLLAPGKRVRALMTLIVAEHFSGAIEQALPGACALEMVHAASLILDDLPSMDNASLRRGQAVNHQVYGEATAILAAVGLLNRSFGVVADNKKLDEKQRIEIVHVLAGSIGLNGLIAGQEQDLRWSSSQASQERVREVHTRKTAALFSAAAEIGTIAAGSNETFQKKMRRFGEKLGLAFQIYDDLLDAVGSRKNAGKDVRQDQNRPSLALMIGYDAAKAEADSLIDQALEQIADNSDDVALRHFVLWLVASLESKLVNK